MSSVFQRSIESNWLVFCKVPSFSRLVIGQMVITNLALLGHSSGTFRKTLLDSTSEILIPGQNNDCSDGFCMVLKTLNFQDFSLSDGESETLISLRI